MTDVEVGGRIDGKYEVIGRIGGGGMGEVYRVRHVHLDEHRVIKVMRPDLAGSQEAIDRFSNEARLATKVKHPYVATLHDFSRLPDGSFYMVWEHIEGQDVEGWLQRRGRFPLSIALELAIQVLAGLEAIHEEGIVHRDLSPDNLMIMTDPRGRLSVKIIDLGLADQVTALGERSERVGGKLNYCSPEHLGLIEGIKPDHVSDLYSFAIVLYRMLTGVLPFPKVKSAGDVAKRREVPPRALSLESVHQLMQKALAFDRAQRFQQASAFRKELASLRESVKSQQQQARNEEGRFKLQDAVKALEDNRLDEAEELLRDLETRHPGLDGLGGLRERLDAVTTARRQVQTMQVRELVEQYIASRQKAMARLSLESLIEIHPGHPEREALSARIDALEQEERRREEVESLVRTARERAEANDPEGARAVQQQLAALDAQAAATVQQLIDGRDRDEAKATEVGALTTRIDALLMEGALDEADLLIGELEQRGASRVTFDVYRGRLRSLRDQARSAAAAEEILRLYPEAVAASNWSEARRLVAELQRMHPDHPRAAQMLSEIDEFDQESRRLDAVAEGVSTLTALLDQGRLDEAKTAFQVLLLMSGGEHPLASHFRQRIRELEERQSG